MDELAFASARIEEGRRELEPARVELATWELRLASISLLEDRLDHSRVRDASSGSHDAVELGAHIEFDDVDTGEHSSFELVSSAEANVSCGRLSVESPVGRAVSGHHAGDTVDVLTPKGRRHLRIVAIG